MNRGEEDYIKTIFELEYESSDGLVTNQQLAETMAHTVQTVNEMVKKLNKSGKVIYTPYKGSRLTEAGRNSALRLIRVHRLWECFLVDHLGYSWDEVHDEAEGLEHVTSEKMEQRLFGYMKEPKYDPLGYPIPDMNGQLEQRLGERLQFAVVGEVYEIVRVGDDQDMLRYLSSVDIGLGDRIKITSSDSFNELMHLEHNGKPMVLGHKVIANLFVRQYRLTQEEEK